MVFLEKGSGARYVYLKSDDRLHPVLNYTSGLLIANAQAPKLMSTSAERLATVPLGDPLGIPDAPDSLPATKDAARPRTGRSAPTASGAAQRRPRSTLLVGDRLTDGTVAAAPGAGPAPRALLVRDPDRADLPAVRQPALR